MLQNLFLLKRKQNNQSLHTIKKIKVLQDIIYKKLQLEMSLGECNSFCAWSYCPAVIRLCALGRRWNLIVVKYWNINSYYLVEV